MKIKVNKDSDLGLDPDAEYDVLETITYHTVKHDGIHVMVRGTDCQIISEGKRLGQ